MVACPSMWDLYEVVLGTWIALPMLAQCSNMQYYNPYACFTNSIFILTIGIIDHPPEMQIFQLLML